MTKKLVILTTHFGKNYSGGSKATCEIFERIQSSFDEIVFVCTEVGDHSFKNAKIHTYSNWIKLCKLLNKLKSENAIFYGDFYNSIWFVLTGIHFFFTYHDNWPDLSKASLKFKLASLFYVPVYKLIFKKAIAVFSVSEFRKHFIKPYNENVFLVRNGIDIKKNRQLKSDSRKIVMVGNIEARKYQLALELFSQINDLDVVVDVYGNTLDYSLYKRLESFAFVNIVGYTKQIPYQNYKLLLHTSMMENMSMVLCEAILSGIPVLAFDVGGAREIIRQGKNGKLIKAFDIIKMKKSLVKMLSGDIKIKNEIKFLKDFSWQTASEKYKQVMLQI